MDALRSVLIRLQQQGAALGHFNVADLLLLKAVLAAAIEVRVPVIVGASEGERDFLGTYELAALVKSMREEHGVPVFLNADHTHSLAKAVPYKFLPAVVDSVEQVVSSRLKLFSTQRTSEEMHLYL